MQDPFIERNGSRPSSTTQTPHRDIYFILTFGITPLHISILPLNSPAQSDHLGIIFDLDIANFFAASYSDIALAPTRMLTSGNKKAVTDYVAYVTEQCVHHQIYRRLWNC